MAYRTTLTPQELAPVLASLGYEYLETSCFSTTCVRHGSLLSVDEPEGEVFEDTEIATDHRLTNHELEALKARKL